MLETAVCCLFVLGLLLCLVNHFSILCALAAGLILFLIYGLLKKHTVTALLKMAWQGIRTVRQILLLLMLIGIMTALWRASGTIAFLVAYGSRLIVPEFFLLAVFVLCSVVSALIGSSFGTAATIGVICMAMANWSGIPPLLAGGAILSGSFFGDRCSPMSTSALLVAQLTGTDLYRNIRLMLRSACAPFLATCAVYLLIGLILPGGSGEDPAELLQAGFRLNWPAALPALLIVLLSLGKVQVKFTMAASIILAAVIAVTVQHAAWTDLPGLLWYGYHAPTPQLAVMLDGGGILSMVKVTAIVCLSSSYAGIFDGTHLLDALKQQQAALCRRLTPFGGLTVTSVVTNMIACNQTLSTILTHQLCREELKDPYRLSMSLENSVVVIAGLIPWSVASAAPLSAIAAPTASIAAACYLYFLPIFTYGVLKKYQCPWGLGCEGADPGRQHGLPEPGLRSRVKSRSRAERRNR